MELTSATYEVVANSNMGRGVGIIWGRGRA